MAVQPVGSNLPGSGVGVSGPAVAQASARPTPLQTAGVQDGPTPQELSAAWRAYSGEFGPDGGPLGKQPGVPDLNVLSNRIKPIVNTGVDFLMGPGVTIRATDAVADEDADDPNHKTAVEVSDAASAAQKLLDATFGDDDQRQTLLAKLATNGGVYGHCFVKVVPPKKGKPSAVNPPRLILVNPETVTIETDPEDADLVVRYAITYATQVSDGRGGTLPARKRQTITRVDPDGDDAGSPDGYDDDTTWEVQDWIATGMSGGQFRPAGDPVTWPYSCPPLVDWQNYPNPNSHWGQRDVTDSLVALNHQLRLVESNINKIGFLQGHPYLYSTGADTGGLRPTPGAILDLGAVDAKLQSVDASGDLAQLMNFAEQLRSDMDEESGVPGVATGRMQDLPRGQVSGVTIRLLYAPLLARTEHKRRLYGQGIRQVCETILRVCGVDAEMVANLEFELGWQDPLPTDDLAMAQTAVALQQIGYSQHTLIDRTGGDPDTEAMWKAEEQQQQMSAVLHGQAMPPAPGASPLDTNTPPADEQGQTPRPASGAKAKGGKNGQTVDPNNPAAVAARAKVKAAFGKPIQ